MGQYNSIRKNSSSKMDKESKVIIEKKDNYKEYDKWYENDSCEDIYLEECQCSECKCCCVGIRGPKGEEGCIGPQGCPGPRGPKGDQVEAGPAGVQGEAGPAGVQGEAGPAGAQGEVGPAGPAGENSDYAVIFRKFGDLEVIEYTDSISFPINEIKGENISHTADSINIKLTKGMSFFIDYTVSYSANTCSEAINEGIDIIFAITNGLGNIIPGSKQVAAISNEVYTNNISAAVIVNVNNDNIIRLTNLTKNIKKVKIHAATVTIFRLA